MNNTDDVVVSLAHFQARASMGFRKASIGTLPPEISLKRLASPKEASFRPAKILRKCHSEHSAAPASSPTDIPAASDQRSMGCGSDMAPSISTRNDGSQGKIFLGEIKRVPAPLIPSDMAADHQNETPKIYLGEWLELLETGISEAAEMAGCKQPYISNIIAGRKDNINVLYLLKISEKLGVTVNDFYRKPPKKSELTALRGLSPRARDTVIAKQRKKG